MNVISFVFISLLALLALSQASSIPSSGSVENLQRAQYTDIEPEVIARPRKKPCTGKGKKKCEDPKEPETTSEDEPEPTKCPEGYVLRGKRCVLSKRTDPTVETAEIPPTVCPKKFELVDGACVKGRISKKPRCPKGTKPSKGMCLVCDPPYRFQGKKCMLPRVVDPVRMAGNELIISDSTAI